jgi:hypothetical protein
MALGTDHMSGTTLADQIPEIWGKMINNFYQEELVMARFFTDRSEELSDGGDTIYTPNITEMTANSKTNGSQVTLNANTDTNVTLTVNTWYECSFLIEDKEAAQIKRSWNLVERYTRNAGFTIASVLEGAIATLFLGFSNTVGASTTNIADSDILNAIATLETNTKGNVYNGDVAFFLHPMVFWRQAQALDKFALAQNSPVQDPVAKKPQYTLYGIPVYVTVSVPYVSGTSGRANVLIHKDAIHFATLALGSGGSMGAYVGTAGIRTQASYELDYLGTLVVSDIAYGVVENRDDAGVLIYTHATRA